MIALFSAPFRPLFLAAALHGLVSIVLWGAFLAHGIGAIPALDPFLWHGHEMLTGFAGAIIGGFLLTASANWTGRPTTTPASLLLLVLLWLIGRLCSWVPAAPALPGLVADGGYWALVAGLVLRVVLLNRNWRNLGFALLPLAFGAVDVTWHLDHGAWLPDSGRPALWTGIDLLTLIMGAMGGRIIPFFTSRRLPDTPVRQYPWLERVAIAALLGALLVNLLARHSLPAATVMLIAGVLLLVRLSLWGSWQTRHEPLLWVLHLGYLWLGLGLLLRALAIFTGWLPEATALHAITVGALGLLGYGMLCRVALGHTGRPLQAGRLLATGFALVLLATLLRLGIVAGLPARIAWGGSACLWALAFALYLWRFVPILLKPRQA